MRGVSSCLLAVLHTIHFMGLSGQQCSPGRFPTDVGRFFALDTAVRVRPAAVGEDSGVIDQSGLGSIECNDG